MNDDQFGKILNIIILLLILPAAAGLIFLIKVKWWI